MVKWVHIYYIESNDVMKMGILKVYIICSLRARFLVKCGGDFSVCSKLSDVLGFCTELAQVLMIVVLVKKRTPTSKLYMTAFVEDVYEDSKERPELSLKLTRVLTKFLNSVLCDSFCLGCLWN